MYARWNNFAILTSSTVKWQHFGNHFMPNSSPSWFTCVEQMGFIQQRSIMCLLKNRRFKAEMFNTHVGQILESILA